MNKGLTYVAFLCDTKLNDISSNWVNAMQITVYSWVSASEFVKNQPRYH